jgi:twitching motility protein PilI
MAKREALRELQTRLAERLQQAQAGGSAKAQWLAIECGGAGFLLPLAEAGEIFPAGPVQPVPHTEPWFLGVSNLRGVLHGVVDLAGFLGLPGAATSGGEGRFVALNAALGSQSALLVQRLAGLRRSDQLQAAPTNASAANRPAFAGALWRDAAGRDWQEVSLAALARHPMYQRIAATAAVLH